MKVSVYSLDESIAEFFAEHRLVTREQCDERALALVGGPIAPVPIQGSFSYTVAAGEGPSSKIVQFRGPESPLDLEVVDKAKRIHGDVVAGYTFHGTIGDALSVFVTNRLPGDSLVMMHFGYDDAQNTAGKTSETEPTSKLPQRSTTVIDLAHFFADSWKAPQSLSPEELRALREDYETRLDLLSKTLPSRFQANVALVRAGLPQLLTTPNYPLVLAHGDLGDLNILVDPATGHLGGVTDWAEAGVAPFGTALYGLERILGYSNATGWHYHAGHEALRALFWNTFETRIQGTAAPMMGLSADDNKAIETGRMLGFFLRYGFTWTPGGRGRGHVVVDEDSSSFHDLDVFCAAKDV